MVHGIPIALGYLSVSFGFGIMAVQAGLPTLATVAVSVTNLTSAGQVAGVSIIAAGGTLLEMLLTQLVINLRYALMGFSLSQKLDGSFTTVRRLVISFGITDEVYGVAISQPGTLTASYMLGLMVPPILGWSAGTAMGALAGQLLPQAVTAAMGLVLYGMFLAIILPVSRKDKHVLFAVLLAAACSCAFYYALPELSQGFAVIISALIASLTAAWLFPLEEVAS
ncbi:MAG: AzlC family ABC transporter permease [Ruminococcaceae bacterium]|nr:AzlC family ABC transporter permease [Oscillospiraceae bacterium]